MAQQRSKKGGGGDQPKGSRLELVGFTDTDERPQIMVFALDRAGKVIDRAAVGDDGGFALSPKALEAAHKVAIGPEADFAEIDAARLKVVRATRIKELIEANRPLELARPDWVKWLLWRRCVRGSVRHCYPFPFMRLELARRIAEISTAAPKLTADLSRAAAEARPATIALRSTAARTATIATAKVADHLLARPFAPIWPHRCDPVCDGIVEVYRRTCCCWPWVIYDPRLPELIAELERIIPPIPEEIWPPVKWPPRPEPDPVPFDALERVGAIKSGAVDERIVNARRDLIALRSLPAEEVPAYINARPYLLCWLRCGPAVKVAQGRIDPDGTFHICWWEWPRILRPNCHDEYAFVVRQHVDGATVTIYDGLSAGRWFHYDDEPVLTSYHPDAESCRHDPFPGEEGAFALLQDIGLAGSWRLKTPPATGWDRVAAPAYNDGLADPAANPADAVGKYLNRNWGGLLRLRYHFSEPMRGLGAKYYRVSVVASDANGDPTGARHTLAPAQWRYYEVIGTDIHVKKVALGPNSKGGQDDLYEIPYDADRDWQSGQYHALLNTREFANGRFLLMLEVFDKDGKLLRPTGTPNPGGSLEAAFTYRRWFQETGPTANVPFAALTHMLWWDNREAVANIVDLRKAGAPNTAECQFLIGKAATDFSIGYRAYHPQPMFMLDHRVWWRRGLGGPSGNLTSPHPNPNNVGVPPAPAHESGTNTFAAMLGPHAKCSFTVNLHVNVKTFDGIGTLDGLDDWDQAAFALEIAAPSGP